MFRKWIARTALVFCFYAAAPGAYPQQKSVDAEGHPWWQHAVFYEIYPRSFADSNNDGIGDLNGIASKLDFGYEFSDYEAIHPMYGTMKDFDRLVSEAKKRNNRVILDFVVNHTSDQHKWFLDSKSSRTSEHRDWYI